MIEKTQHPPPKKNNKTRQNLKLNNPNLYNVYANKWNNR